MTRGDKALQGLAFQTPATQAISLKPIKAKCEDQCPSILTKKYGRNIFSILHAQRKSHRRYPRLKMKEERENLGAWECEECLAALQVSWVSHKTCQVGSCYFSNSFYPFGSLPALVLCFYFPTETLAICF